MNPLGRREPTDWKHVERYPLSASSEVVIGQPIVLGINWYSNFDSPVRRKDGSYWIGLGDLGHIRGGHAICARPDRLTDYGTWWKHYDQGSEGACVGFASSRMQTIRNRRKYDGFWLYHEAQLVDEWPGEDYDGTSVRAGMEVLRVMGAKRPAQTVPNLEQSGILAYRWLTAVDEVRDVLASPLNEARGAIRLLNSWGESYPHFVWMPYEVVARVLGEYGEATVATNL